MTEHAFHIVAGHRRYTSLTDLNRTLNARYAVCEVLAGHQPSGDSVERQFAGGPRVLPICRSCGVPYGGPRSNWSSGT